MLFTLEFGRRDLWHGFYVFSMNCQWLNVPWPLAFQLLCTEFLAIDLRSCRTYRLNRIANVLPIRWTKCEHGLPMVIWTVHYLQNNKKKNSDVIPRHPDSHRTRTYFSGDGDYDGCCYDVSLCRCCDALIPINCFSSMKPTALRRIRFGVVVHRAIDCSNPASPSIRLIFGGRKSFVYGCLRCPNRIRCVDAVNGGDGAFDVAIVQSHVTIHSHCPMFDGYDDVVCNNFAKFCKFEKIKWKKNGKLHANIPSVGLRLIRGMTLHWTRSQTMGRHIVALLGHGWSYRTRTRVDTEQAFLLRSWPWCTSCTSRRIRSITEIWILFDRQTIWYIARRTIRTFESEKRNKTNTN